MTSLTETLESELTENDASLLAKFQNELSLFMNSDPKKGGRAYAIITNYVMDNPMNVLMPTADNIIADRLMLIAKKLNSKPLEIVQRAVSQADRYFGLPFVYDKLL